MEPFLKPLSAQEEKSCLDAYQRGDTKARDILVERNLRLVAHVVKKYQGLPDDLDDLISIGTIGLIKAVMTYDSKKGNRLAAYAARCIDNELLMYLRSKKKTAFLRQLLRIARHLLSRCDVWSTNTCFAACFLFRSLSEVRLRWSFPGIFHC